MKIDIEELAKDTIKELQNTLNSENPNQEKQNNVDINQQAHKEQDKKIDDVLYKLEQIRTPDDIVLVLKDEFKKSEELFLKDVKERLLVLFEGLNINDDKVEQRLKITVEFLEFLLATIEDRLK